MEWKKHVYRTGTQWLAVDNLPTAEDELDEFVRKARSNIEPWLSAVFQSEHLNVLLGSGLTTAVAYLAGAGATTMAAVRLGTSFDAAIDAHAAATAKIMGRGSANIEDQFRSAITLAEGLRIIDPASAQKLKDAIDAQMSAFLASLLATEQGIKTGASTAQREEAAAAVQSFILSFASRAASRDRLHVFTTNYDRLIEYACDLAGIRALDRFVGALNPIFRSSRVEVDVHYNPPGVRGEPRFMEGVIRLTKLHGSLDWAYDRMSRVISRKGIPFGAPSTHSDVPTSASDTLMIYPNPAKDVETTEYPYAELFRDFAASVCRPNTSLVTYGYGFGDDHINRVILDMLAIPSTHLVIISYGGDDRIKNFLSKTRDAQVTLLLGPHFGDLANLVREYLPKPALDYITSRMTDLLRRRPTDPRGGPGDGSSVAAGSGAA